LAGREGIAKKLNRGAPSVNGKRIGRRAASAECLKDSCTREYREERGDREGKVYRRRRSKRSYTTKSRASVPEAGSVLLSVG